MLPFKNRLSPTLEPEILATRLSVTPNSLLYETSPAGTNRRPRRTSSHLNAPPTEDLLRRCTHRVGKQTKERHTLTVMRRPRA